MTCTYICEYVGIGIGGGFSVGGLGVYFYQFRNLFGFRNNWFIGKKENICCLPEDRFFFFGTGKVRAGYPCTRDLFLLMIHLFFSEKKEKCFIDNHYIINHLEKIKIYKYRKIYDVIGRKIK